MESEWSVRPLEDRDDIALVTVELRNPTAVDRRVRVRNRLDGPVLPPRRAGVPEPGWDEDGFAGVVPSGGRHVLGYACPTAVRRPPIAVVDEGRATDEAAEREASAAAAVRGLDDPRPPAAAVPDRSGSPTVDGTADGTEGPGDGGDLPEAVEAWLTAAERRIERGERLTDASVETATDALETADCDDVSALDAEVSADVTALRVAAERASSLAERAAAVDVPVAALRRLA